MVRDLSLSVMAMFQQLTGYLTSRHSGVTKVFHSFFHSIASEKWFRKNSLPALQNSSTLTQYSAFSLVGC
jgi:hypothetical protein